METSIHFVEDKLTVRSLQTVADHHLAFRLRHDIYCQSLHWLPVQPNGLERDHYERGSKSLGIFREPQELLGAVRMIPSPCPFMLEGPFAELIGPHHNIRKDPDTAEVTRLAVRSGGPMSSVSLSALLYKAIYQWSCFEQVRYLYMVVETRYLRALLRQGFPCVPIGPPRLMGPHTLCQAALLDWDQFRSRATQRPSAFSTWLTDNYQSNPAQQPGPQPAGGYAP